ncbi:MULTISPECIES: ABC transporter ATP-binding protein [unclassified Rhodococcus (in: high G+C Gram-positive bacteria)]|uniref:ABC transporter ATP-binding protein n=1 Tax=unclassified Rhodococcus (in: high G+C Gram-positive bacteria) TaxID=192944 RepID=UPI00163976B2|nr:MULTISPECIES: ATP-binding cassette domain-containing protein [unclassified Rhodococcus (in: high G+C Gram-positive bacteria)]MBC2644564.1 ATP-binding cassette domain-containing protein [Rhodococcus sp. 3A]MBC2897747.1 ATP-binding cassette domain-containing protein [Rhodococcus sp. 4CII]
MDAVNSGSPPTVLAAVELYRFFRAGEEEILALRGVSVSVRRGEMVTVAGPSGSGKSTLLACLAGLDEPDGGSVRILGDTISHRPEARRARIRANHIGVLFQHDNLFAHLTVAQNVRLARRLSRSVERQPVREVLARAGIGELADALPSHLSGGEAACAGLAVALANDPAVLLADEPTGELDADSELRLLDLLRARCREGAAVLVASHSQIVQTQADRVVELVDGRVR